MKNRKFTVAILLIISAILYLIFCIKWNHLTEIAIHYFTFLGVIGSGFFAANIGEHAINKGTGNVPDITKPI